MAAAGAAEARLDRSPSRSTAGTPASAAAATQATTPRLEARNVYKIFARNPAAALDRLRQGRTKDEVFAELGIVTGVQDASFSVRPGEIFVIMGLSGSGKSTMVRLMNRLIEPSAGSVEVDGRDLTKLRADELIAIRRRDMSFVFQSFALLPHLTALENAAFGLALAKVPAKARRASAMVALEKVGLGPYAGRFPHEMSGGMQQRVGLARALAKDPTIMFMDEAFSALDPLIRTGMQDELLRLQAEQQRTIVFISHDLDEAMRLGDRIAIMEGGRVVQVGTPIQILLAPADNYVRAFFRNVDPAKVLRACDVADPTTACLVPAESSLPAALAGLDNAGQGFGYVVDNERHLVGVVSRLTIEQASRRPNGGLADALLPGMAPISATTRLKGVFAAVAACEWPVPLVDETGRFEGALGRRDILRILDRAE